MNNIGPPVNNMMNEDNWRTEQFRSNVVKRIEDALRNAPNKTQKSSSELENHIFMKANTKEDYVNFVARLVCHIQDPNKAKTMKPGPPMLGNNAGIPPDQMNNMQNIRPGSNPVLSGLINNSAANRPSLNSPNLLQTLTQRPNPMNRMPMPQASNMNMMNPNNMNMVNPNMNMVNANSMNMVNANNMNMVNANNMNMVNANNMNMVNSTMGLQQGMMPSVNNASMLMSNAGPNMMSSSNINITNANSGSIMVNPAMGIPQGVVQSQNANNAGNLINMANAGNMNASNANNMNMANAGMGLPPGMMAPTNIPMQDGGMMMSGIPQPGTSFMQNRGMPQRQTPTPPQVNSPASVGIYQGGMIGSPAFIGSPNPTIRSSGSGIYMANSPGQMMMNVQSPVNAEEQAYRDKIKQLSKYIEPLRSLIARTETEDEKMGKMKKLLEILSMGQRTPLETLLKCEVALEKMNLDRMDFKKVDGQGNGSGKGSSNLGSLSMISDLNPLVEAVANCAQNNPLASHTLHRTFSPALQVLFGVPSYEAAPKTKKKTAKKADEDDLISYELQSEIAMLDQRFKVSLDPLTVKGSSVIQLECWLDDPFLPYLPPLQVTLPKGYPLSPPVCHVPEFEYSATNYLSTVKACLKSCLEKMPSKYSFTQLLNSWELSVRHACDPACVKDVDFKFVATEPAKRKKEKIAKREVRRNLMEFKRKQEKKRRNNEIRQNDLQMKIRQKMREKPPQDVVLAKKIKLENPTPAKVQQPAAQKVQAAQAATRKVFQIPKSKLLPTNV